VKYDLSSIDLNTLPEHIAIIMDGNGRWAKKRFLDRKLGHKAGASTLEKLSDFASKIGIKYLTVYAFSTENWKRSDDEVNAIMNLLRNYLDTYIKKVNTNDVKIRIIGDKDRLDSDIQEKISTLEGLTKDKKGMCLNIAVNYGGRDDILRAVKNIVKDGVDAGNITEETISDYIDTAHCPDPELLIRTSGESRISNFLLWQLAYSEFYFTDKLWPDFSENDLIDAIKNYQLRDRRFGGR